MPDQRSVEAAGYRKHYGSARWRRIRASVLAENPLCQWCIEREIVEPATEVHHKEPHRGDMTKFWSGPFLATCKSCHASRGQREDLGQTVLTFGADGWPVG
jgi:5-methylcytosine-specific restriction protein A